MKKIDANTRFFLDIDITSKKIVRWGYGQRHALVHELPKPHLRRIFITMGQYHKLTEHGSA